MDIIIQKDRDEMEIIAKSENDYPVLMINQNRYLEGEFPNGDLHSKWRSINKKMINEVKGKVIWSLKVVAPHLINGNLELLDEILVYWYPSHKAFLSMINSPYRKDNFELRTKLKIKYINCTHGFIPLAWCNYSQKLNIRCGYSGCLSV